MFSCFYVLEISNDLRKFAESGFREFFGVISTSDFTLNFQDFDDDFTPLHAKFRENLILVHIALDTQFQLLAKQIHRSKLPIVAELKLPVDH